MTGVCQNDSNTGHGALTAALTIPHWERSLGAREPERHASTLEKGIRAGRGGETLLVLHTTSILDGFSDK